MKRIVSILVVVLILVAVFWGLDFRLMKSQTSSHATTSKMQSGQGSILPRAQTPTGLVVNAEGRLADLLKSELVVGASTTPNLGLIRSLSLGAGETNQPAMVVKVIGQRWTWTPLYAKAALNIEVAYATHGDVSFAEQAVPSFATSSDEPVLQYKGVYDLADVSWGIISYPAYQHYLAEQIAKAVLADWQAQVKD